MAKFRIKRGSSFETILRVRDPNGQSVNLDGYTFASRAVRVKDEELVMDFTIVRLNDSPDLIKVSALPTATRDWPLDVIEFDVKFTRGDGFVFYSETNSIDTTKSITP